MLVTTCVPMKAAKAHHILPKVTVPALAHVWTIPTQTMFASHIANMVNFQSSPP